MTTSLMVFLAIGGIGFLFLMVSLVVGDLLEAFDLDFDADGGNGGEFGLFDSRVISVFLTAFGGIAALGILYGYGFFTSVLAGIGGGAIFGGIIFAFGAFLYSQQSSSSVSDRDLVGRTAKVIVGIQQNGIGQISCKIGEERVEKIARSRSGKAIKLGETVFVEERSSGEFIVSTMDEVGYPLLDE